MSDDLKIISTIAENVRRTRKAAGLSQEELAIEAQLDRTYISQVERGKRNITVVVLARLARAMHTTAAELVGEVKSAVDSVSRGSRVGWISALTNSWAFPLLGAAYVRWWCDDWLILLSTV